MRDMKLNGGPYTAYRDIESKRRRSRYEKIKVAAM
jgi:hypothetical protein